MTEQAEAAGTLREVSRLRGDVRAKLDEGWFPFLAFGTATLLSAPFTLIGDGAIVGLYWMLAAPLAYVLTARHYRTKELELGAEDRRGTLYAVISAGIGVGAFVTGIAGNGNLLSAVGPSFSVSLGLLAIASLSRSVFVAGVAVAIAAVAGAIALTAPDHAALWAAIALGTIGVAAGLVLRPAS